MTPADVKLTVCHCLESKTSVVVLTWCKDPHKIIWNRPFDQSVNTDTESVSDRQDVPNCYHDDKRMHREWTQHSYTSSRPPSLTGDHFIFVHICWIAACRKFRAQRVQPISFSGEPVTVTNMTADMFSGYQRARSVLNGLKWRSRAPLIILAVRARQSAAGSTEKDDLLQINKQGAHT